MPLWNGRGGTMGTLSVIVALVLVTAGVAWKTWSWPRAGAAASFRSGGAGGGGSGGSGGSGGGRPPAPLNFSTSAAFQFLELLPARLRPSPPWPATADSDPVAIALMLVSPHPRLSDWGFAGMFTLVHRLRVLGIACDILLVFPVGRAHPPESLLPPGALAALQHWSDAITGRPQSVRLLVLDPLPIPAAVKTAPRYFPAFQRLLLFQLTQYARIINFDLDILVLNSPAFLLRVPAFASTPQGCNEVEDVANVNAGLVVLEPSEQTFQDLLELAHVNVPNKW